MDHQPWTINHYAKTCKHYPLYTYYHHRSPWLHMQLGHQFKKGRTARTLTLAETVGFPVGWNGTNHSETKGSTDWSMKTGWINFRNQYIITNFYVISAIHLLLNGGFFGASNGCKFRREEWVPRVRGKVFWWKPSIWAMWETQSIVSLGIYRGTPNCWSTVGSATL